MNYLPDNLLGKANIVMDLAAQRQKALGANLANMDTPGYVRKDVDFGQYLGRANSTIETELSTRLGPSEVIQERGGEVDAAHELAEMQKNTLVYSMATKRVTNLVNQMKTVLNVGT